MWSACGMFPWNSWPDSKKGRSTVKEFKIMRGYLPLLLLFCSLGIVFFLPGPQLEGKTITLPEISGWKLEGKPQVFSPGILYEYINGAADLYLDYEFQELTVTEYKGEKKAGVIIEVYRHRDPTQAFGIYSQERLSDAKYLDLGAQGYYEPGLMNFLSGPYYVKINGFNIGEEDERILLPFARKVEEILGEKTSFPSILSSFPSEGKKKNTEKFISRDFLGYPFFHSGYTADYEVAGNKFKVFVIEGKNLEDCRRMMERYLQRTGSEMKQASPGTYQLKDPYHGAVDIIWKGNLIWGILGLTDLNLRSQYLQRLKP
jgi:hypothetical protein